jgi:signal transduction histidine kinase
MQAVRRRTCAGCDSRRSHGAEDLSIAAERAGRDGLITENARLRRQAESAIRTREDFLSMASHELKTPLSCLCLQVDGIRRTLAKSGPADLEKIGLRVDNIDRQVGRLTELVEGLLDVSRARTGRVFLKIEDVDLAQVVRDVAKRFADELASKGYALSLDIEGPLVGRWDRAKVAEIITKFLTNAIKYGAGRPIIISLRRAPALVTIEVSDHGIGISARDQERMFRRFSRVASPQHYAGFGLGLWTAKLLVEAMRGRIEVQSAVGSGSCFRALLPFKTEPGHSRPM